MVSAIVHGWDDNDWKWVGMGRRICITSLIIEILYYFDGSTEKLFFLD